MSKCFRICLLFFLFISGFSIQLFSQDGAEDIDYNKYFSERVLRKAYSDNTPKDYLCSVHAPFLEIGKIVPNGGIHRVFRGTNLMANKEEDMWDIFEESPYTSNPPLFYERFIWCQLENNNGKFLFDDVLDPILKDCINKKSRFIIGLLINSYSHKNVYAGYTKDDDGSIRKYSVPSYIFERMRKTDYPMLKDDLYAKWWSGNIDSPYLYERFERLVKALDKWLEGNVKGTGVKRRDVIFAVEERYLGYWGEGGYSNTVRPKTNMINSYHDILIDVFKDKIIIVPGQLLNHLPVKRAQYSDQEKVVMKCMYNMLSKGTTRAATGLFRDSWRAYDDRYDCDINRVMMNESEEVMSLYDYLVSTTYKEGYSTGEFGFQQDVEQYGLVPYQTLYYSFQQMNMSGMCFNNYSIYEGRIIPDFNDHFIPYGIHQIGRDMLSVTGYRIVMNDYYIGNNPNGSYTVKILFSNIGTSKMFADYYKAHLIIKGKDDNVLGDYICDFDFRSVLPSEHTELGAYNPSYGYVLTYTVPALSKNVGYADLYLRIDDEKGIEYPMTLSNYGREMELNGGDGSYKLGKLK